jgi:hypothetical protein
MEARARSGTSAIGIQLLGENVPIPYIRRPGWADAIPVSQHPTTTTCARDLPCTRELASKRSRGEALVPGNAKGELAATNRTPSLAKSCKIALHEVIFDFFHFVPMLLIHREVLLHAKS